MNTGKRRRSRRIRLEKGDKYIQQGLFPVRRLEKGDKYIQKGLFPVRIIQDVISGGYPIRNIIQFNLIRFSAIGIYRKGVCIRSVQVFVVNSNYWSFIKNVPF